MTFDADQLEREVIAAQEHFCWAISAVFESSDDCLKAEAWMDTHHPDFLTYFSWEIPEDV